jgi:hypothetical protein
MNGGFRRLGSVLLVLVALAALPLPAAAKSSSRCHHGPVVALGEIAPVELNGELEAPVLASYGVLRRASLPGDALPPLNPAGSALENELRSYYPSEIRLPAALPDGRRFFLVPGFLESTEVPPARCLPSVLKGQRPQLVEEEHRRATQAGYCLLEIGGPTGTSGGECSLFSEPSQRPFMQLLSSETFPVLVPDGVASVRILYPGGRTITDTVTENVYLMTPPRQLIIEQERRLKRFTKRLKASGHSNEAAIRRRIAVILQQLDAIAKRTDPTAIEWLGADSAVIRKIPRPSGGTGSTVDSLFFAG